MDIGEKGCSSSPDYRGVETTPGRPEANTSHRYIYYRLYTKDGPLESNNPVYSNDRSISHVLAKSVAPPHTGALLKRHLCRTEGFEELGNYSLYPSLTATITLQDSARLPLRGNTGPGSSESEPMALVVEISSVKRRLGTSTGGLTTLPERHAEPRYVFYRVFEKGGEVASKTSFNQTEPSLGRIETHSIPPPHTVSSLMSRLVKVEKISSRDVQLFEDEYGESIMNDGEAIPLSSDHYPGTTADKPIAIVYESQKSTSTMKLENPAPPVEKFWKEITIDPSCDCLPYDPSWHFKEIYKTDGILRMREDLFEYYVVINSAGKEALVGYLCVTFC